MEEKTKQIIFKSVELLLALLAVSLFMAATDEGGGGASGSNSRQMCTYIGVCAYVWIIAILLIAAILDKGLQSPVSTVLNVVMAVFYLAGGSLVIDDNKDNLKNKGKELALGGGVCALATCATIIVEIVLELIQGE